MDRNVQKVARGLLAHLHLSPTDASVLLDQSSQPETLRVFILDERAARQSFDIKQWRGYRVEIVRNVKFEPHRRLSQ